MSIELISLVLTFLIVLKESDSNSTLYDALPLVIFTYVVVYISLNIISIAAGFVLLTAIYGSHIWGINDLYWYRWWYWSPIVFWI